MAIHFTSDTHFGHKNIIKYCNRPFKSVHHMDEEMIALWNRKVKPNDEVWHLGDFCMGGHQPKDYLPRLNGKVHLIRGNHDPHVEDQGFESVQYYKELKFAKKKIVLCHFPFTVWNKSHHGSIHLFGHVHGSMTVRHGRKVREDSLSADVGSDCWDYAPVRIERIIDVMRKHAEDLKEKFQKEVDTKKLSNKERQFRERMINSL